MLARKPGNKAAQIDADQIGWQAIDGRLKGAVLLPAAGNFRLIIAGEQRRAANRIGRKTAFEKVAGRTADPGAEGLPVRQRAGTGHRLL